MSCLVMSCAVWCSEKRYPVLAEIRLPSKQGLTTGGANPPTDSAVAVDLADTLVDSEAISDSDPKVEAAVLIGTEEEQEHALLTAAIPLCSSTITSGSSGSSSSASALDIDSPRQYQSFFAAHYALEDRNRSENGEDVCHDFRQADALKELVFFVSGFASQVCM
jgi:hypothetical protein